MKNTLNLLLILFLLLAISVNTQARQLTAEIEGTITVSPELDDSGDFTDIFVNIIFLNPGSEIEVDTLFYGKTDFWGKFSGSVTFPERGEYIMNVGRFDNILYTTRIALQDGDDISLSARMPDFYETLVISSFENDAMRDYYRLERNFGRMIDFINSGVAEVTQDTIPELLLTWSDLYWSMREAYPNSIATDKSSLRAIEILRGWHDRTLIERVNESMSDDSFFRVDKISLGADALSRVEDVQSAISLFDRAKGFDLTESEHIELDMHRIELLLDNGMTNESLRLARDLQNQHPDKDDLQEWLEVIIFDLENLSEGNPAPDFEITTIDGDVISNESFSGKFYLIEIVDLSDPSYHVDYTLLNFYHSTYSEAGIEFLTVPLNPSNVAIRAFLEDRGGNWPFANASGFREADLINKVNVQVLPTRLLVDPDGNIVRKYSGTDVAIIEQQIQQLLNED